MWMLAAVATITAAACPAAATPEPWPPPKASVPVRQPPVMVTDSPPPIVAVPSFPSAPVHVLPPPALGPAPPMPVIVRPPQPRTPVQQLVSVNDYPPSALAQRHEGRVAFILDVGPDGRVHGCTITRSSGSSALDSTTCMIMRRRSRFTPAADSNGMPAAGRVADEVEWRLPEQDAAERG